MKRKKLVIISHTDHYTWNGQIVGWGPTVNEVNYLSDHWDEVLHVACLHDGEPPKSSKPYTNPNTRFVPIRPFGGKKIWDKFSTVLRLPEVLRTVSNAIRGASEVQFRAPTGIGIYLLPAFSFFFKRHYVLWVKYAGNWGAEKPPPGYRFQRWWLNRNFAKCKVTINGFWPDQPKHCISFENPCLTNEDLLNGKRILEQKLFKGPFRLAFVGRLEDEKGVRRIIEALRSLDPNQVERIDFIGDGPKRGEYETLCAFMGDKAVFHGFLDNEGVHRILSEAHFLLLPSDSEGFPKVIAEAACYGGIPVVSEVGSIGHYIYNETNGFIFTLNDEQNFAKKLETALSSSASELERKSLRVQNVAEAFSFDHYMAKLERSVLN